MRGGRSIRRSHEASKPICGSPGLAKTLKSLAFAFRVIHKCINGASPACKADSESRFQRRLAETSPSLYERESCRRLNSLALHNGSWIIFRESHLQEQSAQPLECLPPTCTSVFQNSDERPREPVLWIGCKVMSGDVLSDSLSQ